MKADVPHCKAHPTREVEYYGAPCYWCRIEMENNRQFFSRRIPWLNVLIIALPFVFLIIAYFWSAW